MEVKLSILSDQDADRFPELIQSNKWITSDRFCKPISKNKYNEIRAAITKRDELKI